MIECAESPIFIPTTECDSCTEFSQDLASTNTQVAYLKDRMTTAEGDIDSLENAVAGKQDTISVTEPLQKQGNTLSLGPLFIIKQFTCTYGIQPYGYVDLTPQQFGIPNGTPVGYKALTLRQLSSGDNFVSITSWTASAISQGSKFATFVNHTQTFINPTALAQIVFVKESLIDPSSVQ